MKKNSLFHFLKKISVLCSIFGLSSCTADKIPCEVPVKNGLMTNKVRGMSVVAAESPIAGTPVKNLHDIGVNWVAALPYSYYVINNPRIDTISVCPLPDCPHGPDSKHAVMELIQRSKQQGLKVMLKPQLWSAEQWVGQMEFDSEAKWDQFEVNYTQLILEWAQIAENMDVDLFCIGTEIAKFVTHRPNYWRNLIVQIRQVYTGPLTYAANWDDYQAVSFWDELDYIGIDAYFPLMPGTTPPVCELINAWEPYEQEISAYSVQQNRPVLFTEFGYLSVSGCAYNTWELEAKMDDNEINEQAQANALHALVEVFGAKSWWAGGFQWKWYADAVSASCETDLAKDYTPEGKMGVDMLKKLYQ
ncbi:MAG: Unknown protein [uncultured Aureispira sp.]|uniref:Glycoside hydrolase n=1 Tax=uncultured Aureispira sp. TaxID=1331704 RepID=A0A6S6TSE8_9BACT|nr:MAG: Unknown protein [uncultured Aureispira sp.]